MGGKKVCPFFLLENSRPLSPWGPLDFLSTYLGNDFVNTKGTFHAKMGSIKHRNGMDLTEAEDIKKRWQEYTEELYKKDLHNPDNHDSVITQPRERHPGM